MCSFYFRVVSVTSVVPDQPHVFWITRRADPISRKTKRRQNERSKGYGTPPEVCLFPQIPLRGRSFSTFTCPCSTHCAAKTAVSFSLLAANGIFLYAAVR